MPIRETGANIFCGTCGHFIQHYIWNADASSLWARGTATACGGRSGGRGRPVPAGSPVCRTRIRPRSGVRPPDAAPGCQNSGIRALFICSAASAAGPEIPPADHTKAPPPPRSGGGRTAAPRRGGTGPGGPARVFYCRTPCPPGWGGRCGPCGPGSDGCGRSPAGTPRTYGREPLQHSPVGHRRPAVRHHRHLLPVGRAAADGGVHGPRVLPEIPGHDAPVDAGEGVVLELGGELLMGEVVLGRDDETGGVPVDPVDDAGAQGPADAGEGVPAVMEQGVDQRPVRVAGAGWTTSPLGLFTTITSASSYTTSRIDIRIGGAAPMGSGSGRATETVSAPARRWFLARGFPAEHTRPLLAQPGRRRTGSRPAADMPARRPAGRRRLQDPLGASVSPCSPPLLSYFS